jgi:radical SAM-linked protein
MEDQIRLRITFSKTEAMRYTSHLDLHRTWERTIRRAGLPLVYSQGFNPRPKITLACALPLGITSSCEIMDIWLEGEKPIPAVLEALQNALPPGITIHELEQVNMGEASLPTQVTSVQYIAELSEPIKDLDDRLDVLKTADHLERIRRGKTYDLRPLIENLSKLPDSTKGGQRLSMRLSAREGATGRPEEVLNALGIPPHKVSLSRTGLILG